MLKRNNKKPFAEVTKWQPTPSNCLWSKIPKQTHVRRKSEIRFGLVISMSWDVIFSDVFCTRSKLIKWTRKSEHERIPTHKTWMAPRTNSLLIVLSSWLFFVYYQCWQSLYAHSLIKLAPRNWLPIKRSEKWVTKMYRVEFPN